MGKKAAAADVCTLAQITTLPVLGGLLVLVVALVLAEQVIV
jgi:hypothetical protein